MNEGRRRFIRHALAAGVGIGFTAGNGGLASPVTAGCLLSPQERRASPPECGRSRVVEIAAPGVMADRRNPDRKRVGRMLERGIRELSGEDDPVTAWRTFISPDDVVGIKVNCTGKRVMGTRVALVEAVVAGVRKAGVPSKRIFVYEMIGRHFDLYLDRTGLARKKDRLGVRFRCLTEKLTNANVKGGELLPGYDTPPVEFPWGEVRLAELVRNRFTAIINLPVLKDHVNAGVSLALKNISHSSVHAPWTCHDNCCDPYIADINAIPEVRDKVRLHILDGLLGLADGGPVFSSWDHIFAPEKLLLSTDPVAVDTLGCEWIEVERERQGLPPLHRAWNAMLNRRGRHAKHIHTAAARGLGTNNPDLMEKIDVVLPE